jgi:hypothetical protein
MLEKTKETIKNEQSETLTTLGTQDTGTIKNEQSEDCCLTPNQQFFIYIMTRISFMFDGVQCHFQQYFSYIMAFSFIGGGNQFFESLNNRKFKY